jgi:hypothetical protein
MLCMMFEELFFVGLIVVHNAYALCIFLSLLQL